MKKKLLSLVCGVVSLFCVASANVSAFITWQAGGSYESCGRCGEYSVLDEEFENVRVFHIGNRSERKLLSKFYEDKKDYLKALAILADSKNHANGCDIFVYLIDRKDCEAIKEYFFSEGITEDTTYKNFPHGHKVRILRLGKDSYDDIAPFNISCYLKSLGSSRAARAGCHNRCYDQE